MWMGGGVWVACVAFWRSANVACCWGKGFCDPRCGSTALSPKKRSRAQDQGTPSQMILQYTTADCEKERARDGARVLPVYMGKAKGGSVDEASLSSRQDHHHRDHRAGPPVLIDCPSLSYHPLLFLALRDGRMYIRIGVSKVGPGAGQANQCTKIDEDEMKEELATGLAGGRAPLSAVSEVVSCTSSTLETCAMKGKKKRVSTQNRHGGSNGWSTSGLHARHHATSGMRHKRP